MVIIHSFHFLAHLKQFSVPQLKRSHPNLISLKTPTLNMQILQCKCVKQMRQV